MLDRLQDWWEHNRITRDFLRGWRTRIFSAAVFLLGIMDVVDPYTLSSIFGYQYQGVAIIIIGLLGFALREITSTPPGSEGNSESWWAATASEAQSETDARGTTKQP